MKTYPTLKQRFADRIESINKNNKEPVEDMLVELFWSFHIGGAASMLCVMEDIQDDYSQGELSEDSHEEELNILYNEVISECNRSFKA